MVILSLDDLPTGTLIEHDGQLILIEDLRLRLDQAIRERTNSPKRQDTPHDTA